MWQSTSHLGFPLGNLIIEFGDCGMGLSGVALTMDL